jgi:hypothetical protein
MGTGQQQLRTREERRRVMLPARLRSQSGWSDACILNVSEHGLLIYSNGAAHPGSFVDVRRGGQLVIARVVWRRNQRIGLCSPDTIHVDDIISTNEGQAALTTAYKVTLERRRVPRIPESTRSQGRAAEFIGTVLIVAALAGAGAFYAATTLGRPLVHVKAALAGH